MRILIIGNSKAAEILTNFLSENEQHLVFTTKDGTGGNFVDINPFDAGELAEFALANEINLTIAADFSVIDENFANVFNENGLAILLPDAEALKITGSKSYCKKFIYKNKILTPKFAFFDKPQQAVEYIKSENSFPVVIKPDRHSDTETAFIAETFKDAKNCIEKLFQRDNKKILIEEYIYGKEASFYALSDGFNPVLTGSSLSYAGEISIKDALGADLEERVYNEIIFPVVSNLAASGAEYVGILGFDVIFSPRNKIYLIECNPFFKDIDTEIMLCGTEEDFAKLFLDTITGTLAGNYETPFSMKRSREFYGAFRLPENESNEEIVPVSARTQNLLKEKMLEEGLDTNILRQAEKLWKIC